MPSVAGATGATGATLGIPTGVGSAATTGLFGTGGQIGLGGALPQLATRLNPAAVVLLGVGGLAYTAGAIVYARRRPDPLPAVFGYHELFHALTLVAVACQYVAIAFFVIRAG